MRLFDCKGCAAKDNEIRWLRQRVEALERFKAEVEKPGILRSVEAAPKKPERAEPPPRKPAPPTLPGYEPTPLGEVEVT